MKDLKAENLRVLDLKESQASSFAVGFLSHVTMHIDVHTSRVYISSLKGPATPLRGVLGCCLNTPGLRSWSGKTVAPL